MMDPSTSKRKESEELPDPKRLKPEPLKSVLEAFNADGSMDMSLLKKIARGCLECLNERNATESSK